MQIKIHSLLKVYMYGGIASTTCIALTLISAVTICPALSQSYGENILSFLVALAVGCLTGDSIFHLLPHVFLGESTGNKARNSNLTSYGQETPNSHDMTVVWHALPIACTIFIFYFLHLLSDNCQTGKEHSHSHSLKPSKTIVTQEENIIDKSSNVATASASDESTIVTKTSANPPKELPVVVWMIIIGDVVHSFSDGVAIGGAYAKTFYGGLGTTVAIIFHEVPHGVGDFAVMVTAGLSTSKSLVLLSFVLVPMYLGMILGATLGHVMDLTRLIFAVTAGMFLFISLVEMLPRILESNSKVGSKWKLTILHSGGIMLGMLTMLGIAVLEGRLSS